MRTLIVGILVATSSLTGIAAHADDTAAHAAHTAYSTAETPLGDLLDNAATKAILMKYLPNLVGNDQIQMARGMTLKALQSYAADEVTDEKLAAIDADLAKLPAQ